jgi:lipoprotein signal peptidase
LSTGLLIQTIISGLLVSAAIAAFLLRFAPPRPRWPQLVCAVFVIDHGSKWIITHLVRGGELHTYLGGAVGIGHYTNYLQGFGRTSPWLLCATLVVIIAGIRLYQMLLERGYEMSWGTEAGLALVLGGVMAAACERMWSGRVVDFLSLGAQGSYVYNFADVAALGGMLLLFTRGAIALPGMIGRELAGAGAAGGAE